MKNYLLLSLYFFLLSSPSLAQDTLISLWPEKIPNQNPSEEKEVRNQKDILYIENVQNPSLEVYLPTKRTATGKAVVICPGGGYRVLAYDWEGSDIAKWLNSQGIAAFVLKYRLPYSKSLIVGHQAPLQDAQRALRLVRHHAENWNVSQDQIGIMGFSAGGHLASTLGTHYEEETFSSTDPIDKESARPDFMALIYPVISMQEAHTHKGSKNNLLGKDPSPELISHYSNELHIDKNTPPTFLVHSTDDKGVSVMNSILFYQALAREDVYSEMHIYPTGGHGYALGIGKGHFKNWTLRFSEWLESLD